MKELKQVGRALLRSYEKPETLCLLPSIGALKSRRMLPGFECRSGRAGNVPLDLKFAGQRFAALSLV